MTAQPSLSPDRIAESRTRVLPEFLASPLLATEVRGMSLVAKDETANPIRSFKGRGTSFLLAADAPDSGPLVTASAGNFGQGLAYAAARQGRRVTVFASLAANPVKIDAMCGFRAEVILKGEDFDAAKAAAREHAAARGLTFVEDGASAPIAEGAGTIAAEITDAFPGVDAVFVPLGNGALAAGIGCWFKAHSPATRGIAVAARGAPCMALSWRAGAPVPTARPAPSPTGSPSGFPSPRRCAGSRTRSTTSSSSATRG